MTPMPAWYVILREIADDHDSPADVADACAQAVAHIDELRTAYTAAWAPTPLPWRHTLPGDAFVGQDGTLWRITASQPAAGTEWRLDVAAAGEAATTYLGDRDETVDVLVPALERDAFLLLRAELGAQLVDRTAA